MNLTKEELQTVRQLQLQAAQNRRDLVNLTYVSGYSHLGGPLSACDFLTALYFHFIHWDKDHQHDPERDRFILSKGHNGILLFTIFCDMGMYDWDLLLRAADVDVADAAGRQSELLTDLAGLFDQIPHIFNVNFGHVLKAVLSVVFNRSNIRRQRGC